MDSDAIVASSDEIIVIISGTKESMAQAIHARTAYIASELQWNKRFVDVLGNLESGRRSLDYSRFHKVEPI
ncbi:hypothetical protein KX816_19540 [Sphingosinicellaceae bacterium]|nr:hypothetical protein KX816_19540 [Sphingosinicellaceae bacterium]